MVILALPKVSIMKFPTRALHREGSGELLKTGEFPC
jgi:hypothetical protein